MAKDLTWHADRRLEERIEDDKIRHPSDSPQWKKIDDDFPEFGEESRNLRLVLATDGMNPHGLQSSSHSTWPVILMIYNLPPLRCMKREHIMMPILISGLKQRGNDIDVYLAPLIETLKVLWRPVFKYMTGSEKKISILESCYLEQSMIFRQEQTSSDMVYVANVDAPYVSRVQINID